jgi:adenylylsulfate kinase
MVIWFTGMSGSGKSTLSKKLITYLNVNNEKVLCLDGDEIREKVDYKNDFSIESIKQNNINIIQLCKNNINSYKYIVVSVIAPLEETRVFARKVLGENYIEIFIKASLRKLVERDTKGLYKRALNGKLKNLIGVDTETPYETPIKPNLIINTDTQSEKKSFDKILKFINEKIN